VARVTATASHRQYSGGLTEDEIALLYGGLIAEAEAQFGSDVSYLADIVTGDDPAKS
jgi:hypothetical protein